MEPRLKLNKIILAELRPSAEFSCLSKCVCVIVGAVQRARSVWRLQAGLAITVEK